MKNETNKKGTGDYSCPNNQVECLHYDILVFSRQPQILRGA